MIVESSITRESLSPRGGGVELDLTHYGYTDHKLSAYQNYLGGGMLGSIENSSTITNWIHVDELCHLAVELQEYYKERMVLAGYIEEHNEDTSKRPVSAY